MTDRRTWPVGLRLTILLVLVLMMVPLSVLVYVEVSWDHARAVGQARETARVTQVGEARRIHDLVHNTENVLKTLAASASVRQHEWPRAEGFMRRILSDNSGYLNVAVVDLNGRVLASAVTADSKVNLSDREYFRHALSDDAFVVGDYQIGRITGRPSVACALPLHDDSGRQWGVAFAALDVRLFEAAIGASELPSGTVVTVFDDDGRVVARTPDGARYTGQKVPEDLLLKKPSGGTRELATIPGLDGVPRLWGVETAFERNGQGLFVATGMDERALFSDEWRQYLAKLASSSAMGAIILLAGWLAMHFLVLGQVRALRDTVGRLAKGDLDARANLPRTGDEIGQLAEECDAMAAALGEQMHRIERDERQYRELARLLPVGVFMLDEKRVVRFTNDAGLAMLGVASLPAEGVPFFEHVRERDRRQLADYLDSAAWGERRPFIEIALINGRETEVEFMGTAFDDQAPYVLCIAHDVTERKAVDLIKSDFLSMVSHELRTPLTNIIGYAQLLEIRPDDGPEKTRHLVERIEERAEQMRRMIEELLTVLQAEARTFCSERQQVDLRTLVERCVADLDVPATHRIELDVPRKLMPVSCDPQAVARAVSNLLGNAIKFSPEGGSIGVRITQQDGRTRIDVSDEGVGVPVEERERIFERFAQADMSSTREFSGFGVGLFIVREVAREHGGRAYVESAPGGGSVFTLELDGAA